MSASENLQGDLAAVFIRFFWAFVCFLLNRTKRNGDSVKMLV